MIRPPFASPPNVCKELDFQVRVVTGDAGRCERQNAALCEPRYSYRFTLKGNQPHRHGLACAHRQCAFGRPLARSEAK